MFPSAAAPGEARVGDRVASSLAAELRRLGGWTGLLDPAATIENPLPLSRPDPRRWGGRASIGPPPLAAGLDADTALFEAAICACEYAYGRYLSPHSSVPHVSAVLAWI